MRLPFLHLLSILAVWQPAAVRAGGRTLGLEFNLLAGPKPLVLHTPVALRDKAGRSLRLSLAGEPLGRGLDIRV